jgi:hypothetical protein
MTDIYKEATISLHPERVSDETLAVLNDELQSQTNYTMPQIRGITTFVLDSNDNGLDSHATVHVAVDNDNDDDGGDA